MRHSRVLVLSLVVCGCAGTSPEPQVPAPRPEVERSAQSDSIALIVIERYPPVDPRWDLGEFLIDKDGKPEKDKDAKPEIVLVRKSIEAVEEVIQLRARDKHNIGRGDHAKPLGCYAAKFTVSARDVVRIEDQAGIAKPENLGKTFDASVRFSNSEPKNTSDYLSATMGLAIKVKLAPAKHSEDEFLLGPTEEQDFIAGGLRTFVSRNIADYADLVDLRVHRFRNALAIANRHPEAFAAFAVEPFERLLRPTSIAAPMVLEKPFSSLLPYAWGDSAVKFRFEPCHKEFDRSKESVSRFDSSYQSKVVTKFVESNDICYLMKIQARPRASSAEENRLIEKTFPIEDAMVSWPEPGEFREVARVMIERGSRAMPDLDCECLAFNPWNGLKAHQPLGSLNRARWAVYKGSELVRRRIYDEKTTSKCPDSAGR